MKKTGFLFSAFMLAACCTAWAQNNTQPQNSEQTGKNLPSVTLGAGALFFKGDVGSRTQLSLLNNMRAGYSIRVEQRFAKMIGVGLTGLYGKVAKEERSPDTLYNRNFESPIMQFGLNVSFHFDNDIIMRSDEPLAPFIFVGFSYLKFEPYGDLKDKNGIRYNYWTDGSIRDLPESPGNYFTALYMHRDYTYESKLDSTSSYAHTSFAIPMGLGFKLKVNPSVEISLNATYNMLMTDYIDNVKDGGNDSYWYGNVGLTWNFGKMDRSDKDRYSAVDFTSIDNIDSDGDGVIDTEDDCNDTPKGVEVNKRGCGKDGDGDGVPDYRDKEPNTKKDALVDLDGVTLTDAKISEQHKNRDSLAMEREEMVKQNPSTETLEKIDTEISKTVNTGTTGYNKLPDEIKPADLNKDGIITSAEINAAIDGFFDGSNDFTVEKLHKLIDFFFEQ